MLNHIAEQKPNFQIQFPETSNQYSNLKNLALAVKVFEERLRIFTCVYFILRFRSASEDEEPRTQMLAKDSSPFYFDLRFRTPSEDESGEHVFGLENLRRSTWIFDFERRFRLRTLDFGFWKENLRRSSSRVFRRTIFGCFN